MNSFTLDDSDGERVETIVVMDKDNDPNHQLTEYQFALFPKNRLEWGSRYNAELLYDYDGSSSAKNWCFVTRSLRGNVDRFYRITEDINLKVVSGKEYALYLVPQTKDQQIYRISYSYNTDKPNVRFIDNNTIAIKMTGSQGKYSEFEFKEFPNSTKFKVKLTIASTDTAILPLKESCDYDGDGILDEDDLDDDNDGYSDIDEIKAGSNPKDANSKPLDTDGDKIPNILDSDDDNDGISDTDELANGLDPLNASDAQADFDNDGFSNSIEINAGSDINSQASHPTWTPVMMDNIIIFIPSY